MSGWTLAAALAAAASVLLTRPPRWPRAAMAGDGAPAGGRSLAGGRRSVLVLGVPAAVVGVGWWALSLRGSQVVPPTVIPGAAVLAGAAAAAAGLVARRRRRRAAVARADRVLEACELLAAELGSGLPAGRALARAAAAEPLLGAAASADRLGADVGGALRGSATVPGAGGLARLAAAWEVSRRTGQRLAPASASAAEGLRRDRATRRVVDAELASARATARLLAALPVLALLMGSGTGGEPWAFLLGTAPGLACLTAGLALGSAGLAWIERITDAAEAAR